MLKLQGNLKENKPQQETVRATKMATWKYRLGKHSKAEHWQQAAIMEISSLVRASKGVKRIIRWKASRSACDEEVI